MKILHTSDWHLGHSLYNYDRQHEQQQMLNQIVEIVKQEQPDAFLLCGDIYHTSQPSSAVQTMFTEALVNIHNACPQMTIVVTAGNHDSAAKHDIFRTPWRALGVYTFGNLNRDDVGEHIVKVGNKGYVIAVPYINERNLPQDIFVQLSALTASLNTEQLPVLLTAHTTVSGCDFTGHDQASERTVGGIDSIGIEQFGNDYDYLALGHIHHAQFIHTGKHNVRYSGSPLPVSFDESFAHSVSIVEIARHGDTPAVRTIDIDNPHPLVTLPTTGFATFEEAKTLLADFPADIPAYIRLNVEVEHNLPADANAQAFVLTEGKQCRFCYINARRKTQNADNAHSLSIQEFQAEKPIDIARRYANDIHTEFDDELLSMFKQAQSLVEEDLRNL